jgi:hypothetical protein
MEQDVADMLWSLMGSALHVVAERGQTENHITEERLTVEIDKVTLSGAIDLQHIVGGVCKITDYKFTSVWSIMNDKPDWVTQQNIYAWMVRKVKNIDVNGRSRSAPCSGIGTVETLARKDTPQPLFRSWNSPCGLLRRLRPISKNASPFTSKRNSWRTWKTSFRSVPMRIAGYGEINGQ